ncbi:MAG: periplasmic heavy metal sensor [Myxococcota bacterium]
MYASGRHGSGGPWCGRAWHRGGRGHGGGRGAGGGGLGMRRPLRFLVDQLDLSDAQANAVSKALDDLRLEREQAALDRRRASSKIADLVTADTLDAAALGQAAEVRVAAAQRARDAVVAAVTAVHAALQPEQRAKLAILLRGPLAL